MGSDFRYALRQLRKSPGFAAATVLTLALGIGVNLAVFQLLYAVLFTPLPVSQPAQLYSLHAVKSPFDEQWFFSFPAYRRLREAAPQNTAVVARSGMGEGVLQEGDGAVSRARFQLVSDNFFSVMGLAPVAGHFFTPGDDAQQVTEWPVVLRYGFFKEHFAGDRSILGRRATINGIPMVIEGIAPEGFNGVMEGSAPDFWLPLAAQSAGRLGTWFDSLGPGYGVALDKSYLPQPSIFWLWVLARVPDGDKSAAAARWRAAIAPDLSLIAGASKEPEVRAKILSSPLLLVSAAHGEGTLADTYSLPLFLLMSMAVAILLAGCLNLANLQISRLLQRQREIAVCIALGASRARVLRQVIAEALVLAAIGGALAWLTGRAASSLLLHWASGRGQTLPIDVHMHVAASLLGVALLLAALAGFGLWPAWRFTRRSFAAGTRNAAMRGQTAIERGWSQLFLAAQVSFSLLLLSGAALFSQTLRNLAHVDVGMDREHILSVHLDMHSTGFADGVQNLPVFYDGLLQRLKALPGVQDAAVQMCSIPRCEWNTSLHVYGSPGLAEARTHGEENHVGLGYFHTLGMPLLLGRDFSEQDNEHGQPVAILNRAYARQLFGAASPIGHYAGYVKDDQFLIVGEVADARVDGLRAAAPPVLYLPLNQNPAAIGTAEVRFRGSPEALPAEIRDGLHAFAPALPVTEIVPLDVEFNDGLGTEALVARLSSVFAGLTLVMAALGFYGVLSFRVAQRTAEIGLRMAVGATRGQVQAMFLRHTLGILLIGLVPGVALSVAMSFLARKLLYGAATMNVVALVFAIAALLVAGIAATVMPARRAATIEPLQALRGDW